MTSANTSTLHDPCEIAQQKCLSIRGWRKWVASGLWQLFRYGQMYAIFFIYFYPPPKACWKRTKTAILWQFICQSLLEECSWAFDSWRWTVSQFWTFNTNKCFSSTGNLFSQVKVLLLRKEVSARVLISIMTVYLLIRVWAGSVITLRRNEITV